MPDSGLAAGIRNDLERAIRSGAWAVGSRVPTEHALMAQYGCARMTAHKVLAALAANGLIVRRRRAGSFVAPPPAERAVLTIADFAEEAARTGRAYRHEIITLIRRNADDAGFAPGERLVAVTCRHLFDAVPVAWEERLIRVASVPAVARARFRAESPGAWLLRHVPWSEADHEISAATADRQQAARLDVKQGAALLCLHRRTWFQQVIVTDVRLIFPGTRYRFSGRFRPPGAG